MLSKPLVNLFNRNPQLFREIKGRLTVINVAIAISASLFCQFIVIMSFVVNYRKYSHIEIADFDDVYTTININWPYWWANIFVTFSLILFALILVGGVYMLVADLAKEERLGTLNFLRLTPQSSQNILLGKLLGVPILIYVAAAIFLPLNLWAIISSGLSLSWFLTFYGILITVCCFFYNASLLFVFLGGTQAWLAATIAFFFFFYGMYPIGLQADEIHTVMSYNRIEEPQITTIGVIILGLVLGSYWIWQAVNRRYRNPNSTVISKKQSYWLMVCFQVYLLLFFLEKIGEEQTYLLEPSMYSLFAINLFWFLLIIAFLSSPRQTVQDWARYRNQKVNNHKTAIVKGLPISLKKDLIWGEKSPALVAIAINLVITAVIWILWILVWILWNNQEIKLPAILMLIIRLNLILIYAAIAQFILLMKVKNPRVLATGILGALIFLQPFVFRLFLISSDNYPSLWLSSISISNWFYFIFDSLDYIDSIGIRSMIIAIISQWSILTLVTLQLTRKIRNLGKYDSQKSLMPQHK